MGVGDDFQARQQPVTSHQSWLHLYSIWQQSSACTLPTSLETYPVHPFMEQKDMFNSNDRGTTCYEIQKLRLCSGTSGSTSRCHEYCPTKSSSASSGPWLRPVDCPVLHWDLQGTQVWDFCWETISNQRNPTLSRAGHSVGGFYGIL